MKTIIKWRDGAKETPSELRQRTIIMDKNSKSILSTFRWNSNMNAFFDCAGSSYTFDPWDVYWALPEDIVMEE